VGYRLLIIACAMTLVTQGTPPAPREDAIHAIAARLDGEVGLFAKHLGTDQTIALNADVRFPTASVIKVAVLIEAYRRHAEGSLPLDTPQAVPDAIKVGGSGILRELHDGARLTLRDLAHLMIVLSDNSATNVLVERLGAARINETARGMGFPNTRIFRPTFRDGQPDVDPDLERQYGLGMSTPREMAALMEAIAAGRAVNPDASREMRDILTRQQDRTMIPRRLPAGTRTATKSGTDSEKQPDESGVRGDIRNDAGIVEGPSGTYVVAIFTRRVRNGGSGVDHAAATAVADLSRAVFERLQ
jgi:beta-lactamase class A